MNFLVISYHDDDDDNGVFLSISVCVYTDISKSKFLKKQQIQFNYFALLVSFFFVSLYLIYNLFSSSFFTPLNYFQKKKVKVIRN